MIDARKALLELWLFYVKKCQGYVLKMRGGGKEYAEHGSSEMLTFVNFHVRVPIG